MHASCPVPQDGSARFDADMVIDVQKTSNAGAACEGSIVPLVLGSQVSNSFHLWLHTLSYTQLSMRFCVE